MNIVYPETAWQTHLLKDEVKSCITTKEGIVRYLAVLTDILADKGVLNAEDISVLLIEDVRFVNE